MVKDVHSADSSLSDRLPFSIDRGICVGYIGRNLNKSGEYAFGLRKINSQDFRIATRKTSREINRRILLNLVREHQPISVLTWRGGCNWRAAASVCW